MKAAQVNRAARAAASGLDRPRPNKGSTLLKPVPMPRAVGPIRNRRATKMTAIQRNGIGRLSEWSRAASEPRGGWR